MRPRSRLRARAAGALALLALAAPLAPPLGAQGTAVTLDELQTPSAPAFVLLGIEPASVQRPDSPQALRTSFLALARDPGALPRSFALEVTPFWLRSRPTFAFDDFYARAGRTPLQTIGLAMRRSFALSVASTPGAPGGAADDTLATHLGVGARLVLWPGRPSALLASLRGRAPNVLRDCSRGDDLDAIEACMRPFVDSVRANLEPVGFVLQLAFGASGGFPDGTVDGGRLARAGVWLTPSWRVTNQVELIAVGRWLHADLAAGDTANADLLDGGVRLRWKPSPLLAISAEGLGRRGQGGTAPDQTASRWGAVAEYRAAENLFVFYSFGKDFEAANAPRSRLLSTLGLQLGFGPKPVVAVR